MFKKKKKYAIDFILPIANFVNVTFGPYGVQKISNIA